MESFIFHIGSVSLQYKKYIQSNTETKKYVTYLSPGKIDYMIVTLFVKIKIPANVLFTGFKKWRGMRDSPPRLKMRQSARGSALAELVPAKKPGNPWVLKDGAFSRRDYRCGKNPNFCLNSIKTTSHLSYYKFLQNLPGRGAFFRLYFLWICPQHQVCYVL